MELRRGGGLSKFVSKMREKERCFLIMEYTGFGRRSSAANLITATSGPAGKVAKKETSVSREPQPAVLYLIIAREIVTG